MAKGRLRDILVQSARLDVDRSAQVHLRAGGGRHADGSPAAQIVANHFGERPVEIPAICDGDDGVVAGDNDDLKNRLRPNDRGDALIGACYLRYQSVLQIAERWVRAPLEQTVRIYPNLEEAKRHSIYLLRSRQIALEKRRTRIRGRIGCVLSSLAANAFKI